MMDYGIIKGLAEIFMRFVNRKFMKEAHTRGSFYYDYSRSSSAFHLETFMFEYRVRTKTKDYLLGDCSLHWDTEKESFTELYIHFLGGNAIKFIIKSMPYLVLIQEELPFLNRFFNDPWHFNIIGNPSDIKKFNKEYDRLCRQLIN